MEGLLTADALIALITLTVLEIVLGVDNVIFISILAGKLPADQQDRARKRRTDGGDGHAHRCCCSRWPGSSGSPSRSSRFSGAASRAAT